MSRQKQIRLCKKYGTQNNGDDQNWKTYHRGKYMCVRSSISIFILTTCWEIGCNQPHFLGIVFYKNTPNLKTRFDSSNVNRWIRVSHSIYVQISWNTATILWRNIWHRRLRVVFSHVLVYLLSLGTSLNLWPNTRWFFTSISGITFLAFNLLGKIN